MKTGSTMRQAVGTAAALSVASGVPPRELNSNKQLSSNKQLRLKPVPISMPSLPPLLLLLLLQGDDTTTRAGARTRGDDIR